MEFVLTALPFLLFLACPLMMLICVVGMRRAGCRTRRASGHTSSQTREERVVALEGQLATIQTELAALRAAEAKPAPGHGLSTGRPEAEPIPEVGHAARRPA